MDVRSLEEVTYLQDMMRGFQKGLAVELMMHLVDLVCLMCCWKKMSYLSMVCKHPS